MDCVKKINKNGVIYKYTFGKIPIYRELKWRPETILKNGAIPKSHMSRDLNGEVMSKEFTGSNDKTECCNYCGRNYIIKRAPFGFTWDYKGHKGYCSNKCKLEAEGHTNSNSATSDDVVNEKYISAEQISARAKEDKEFFDSMKRNWKIWVSIAAVLVVLFILMVNDINNKKADAVKINHELEMIEDQVRLAIQTEEKQKALELTNKLFHPLHEVYEGKGGVFNAEYYDTFWDKKREYYKDQIMKIGIAKTENNKLEQPEDEEPQNEQNAEDYPEDTTVVAE